MVPILDITWNEFWANLVIIAACFARAVWQSKYIRLYPLTTEDLRNVQFFV